MSNGAVSMLSLSHVLDSAYARQRENGIKILHVHHVLAISTYETIDLRMARISVRPCNGSYTLASMQVIELCTLIVLIIFVCLLFVCSFFLPSIIIVGRSIDRCTTCTSTQVQPRSLAALLLLIFFVAVLLALNLNGAASSAGWVGPTDTT